MYEQKERLVVKHWEQSSLTGSKCITIEHILSLFAWGAMWKKLNVALWETRSALHSMTKLQILQKKPEKHWGFVTTRSIKHLEAFSIKSVEGLQLLCALKALGIYSWEKKMFCTAGKIFYG